MSHGRPLVSLDARTPGHRHASGQGRLAHNDRKGLHQVFDLSLHLAVAEGAMRGVAGRPMILAFRPRISAEAVSKRAPANRPDWVDVAERYPCVGTVPPSGHSRRRRAGVGDGVCGSQPHPARRRPDHPDELRWGLDPMPGAVAAGRRGRVGGPELEDYGLTAWLKTSVAGLSYVAWIAPCWSFPGAPGPPRPPAREVERRLPDAATSRWWKEEREGVFADFNQNAKDRTVASALLVRATPMFGRPRRCTGRRCWLRPGVNYHGHRAQPVGRHR